MNVSSDISSQASAAMQESSNKAQESQSAMKNTLDVQEKQLVQIIDAATEESKEMTAQKTGMGNSINLTA